MKYLFILIFSSICNFGHSEKGNQFSDIQNGSGSVKGYQAIAEIGYGFKVSKEDLSFLKVNFINGYRINSRFYLGAGTGLRLFFDNNALFNSFAAYPIIPFFADFRLNLNHNKISPYTSLDIGYSFDVSSGFLALGLLLNPAAGITIRISDKLEMHVGIGFDYQGMKTDDPDERDKINAISLNIGLDFLAVSQSIRHN